MVIYGIHNRKRYFLLPWISEILIELTGAIVFGSVFCYNFWKFEGMHKLDGLEANCDKIHEKITKNMFLTNAVITAVYAAFLLYLEVVACSFYYHCIQTDKAKRIETERRQHRFEGIRRGTLSQL